MSMVRNHRDNFINTNSHFSLFSKELIQKYDFVYLPVFTKDFQVVHGISEDKRFQKNKLLKTPLKVWRVEFSFDQKVCIHVYTRTFALFVVHDVLLI